MTDLPPLDAASGAIAQRIRFVVKPASGATALRTFTDPYGRSAVAEDLAAERLLEATRREPPAADEFYFLFLPSGAATAIEWQRAAEEWMNGPSPPAERPAGDPSTGDLPTIDFVAQSDRILWRPGRAVLVGGAKRLEETRAGLIDFSFHEGELRKLEGELEADWPRAESDALPAHDVDRRALDRCGHVGEMSQRMALRRIRLARLAPRLEKASLSLAGSARRLVGELALHADVVDRLKHVDDRLEVFEDLYELANDRLAEFRCFRLEYRLEAWIIAILVIEVAVMFFEIWWTWWLD
ncbi:MAG TPA: hypothetical protein VMV69_15585 [Pirellulales bacterium]|nr:hypothetical protein [Pirellulales bacterium]